MTDAEQRLIRQFLSFLRDDDLAICVRVDEPEGTRVHWQPISRGGRRLLQDFERRLGRREGDHGDA